MAYNSEKAIRRLCVHVLKCAYNVLNVLNLQNVLQLELGAVSIDQRVVDPSFLPRFGNLLGAERSCQRRVSGVELPWSRVERRIVYICMVSPVKSLRPKNAAGRRDSQTFRAQLRADES